MQLSQATLDRNLSALRERDPALVERLALPVESDHVIWEAPAGGGAPEPLYRPHLSAHPLRIPAERARELCAPAGAGAEVLVFGVGSGELVAAALARGAARVLAWDRDPWLWRVALATHDWSQALRSGRLAPALGIDVLRLAEGGTAGGTGGARPGAVVDHPVLAAAYARERALLAGAPRTRRALLCAGGLFVDPLGRALAARGYGLYTLDVERLAVEELDLAVERFDPELVVSVNYRHGLAEFCRDRGRRLVCWEVDPAASHLPPVGGGGAGDTWIFTYRRAHVAAFRRAGFPHAEYLPLAADPEVRAPQALSEDERERYGAPISFVGSSMVASVAPFAGRFAALYRAWRPEASTEEAVQLLGRVLERQRADLWTWRVPEALDALAPGLRAAAAEAGGDDPAVLAGELAASERRLALVAGLGSRGLHVWGDEGWSRVEAAGARYRGPAGHSVELTRIYAASAVNLDVGRLFQGDIVTMRVFDVLATGALVLTERNAALEELFDVGRELAAYGDARELDAHAARFAADRDEARRVAERGRRAVLARHTVAARLDHMLARAAGAEPPAAWARPARSV